MSDTITLPCLSIQQPWAWAIINAGKDIENRNWKTKFRGVFLIHAGKVTDAFGMSHLFDIGIKVDHDKLHTGGIVGIAEITDCVSESSSKWFFGPIGWKLQSAIELPFHPCKGKLKFFNVEYPRNDVIENYLKYKGW